MNIFVACGDVGEWYPAIAIERTYWACAYSFDDIEQLTANNIGFYNYIYELTPGTTGYVNRWRYSYETRAFELWNE